MEFGTVLNDENRMPMPKAPSDRFEDANCVGVGREYPIRFTLGESYDQELEGARLFIEAPHEQGPVGL